MEDIKTYLVILFFGIQIGVLITLIMWALSNSNDIKDLTKKINGKDKPTK